MIRSQLLLFGASFLTGAALAMGYRAVRYLDRYFLRRAWMRLARDILYGACSGLVLYGVLFALAGGTCRLYVLLGAGLGWQLLFTRGNGSGRRIGHGT